MSFWTGIKESTRESGSGQIPKLFRYVYIVLQLAIQYAMVNNRKDGAYYGNKKCKCNGLCAA